MSCQKCSAQLPDNARLRASCAARFGAEQADGQGVALGKMRPVPVTGSLFTIIK